MQRCDLKQENLTMCHQKHISELDNLAKQLWIVHRELTHLGDPLKARSVLDPILDRLEVRTLQLPQHHVAAVNGAQQAYLLAHEARSLLHDNLSGFVDPEVVAAGLLTVARARLQQACQALEKSEWYRSPEKAWKPA